MEIIRIKYADSDLPESWVFAGGSKDQRIPIIFSVFLIKTAGKNILVDAGCETMEWFQMRNFQSPVAVLREMGYEPSDITDVIITHAHHDHIEAVKHFSNAVIHIQQDEYETGKKYIPADFKVHTFAQECELDAGIRVVAIGGHSIGSCVVEVKKDQKTYVLCGDECYSYYNLVNKVPTAKSFNKQQSSAFIDQYTKDPYTCLLCHEANSPEP